MRLIPEPDHDGPSDPVERRLLTEVLASPDEDGPRLVYADWWTERGDARGAFVAAQCRMAAIEPYSAEWRELRQQTEQILAEHEESWVRPLRAALSRGRRPEVFGCAFVRGFVSSVALSPEHAILHLDRLTKLAPLREVRIRFGLEFDLGALLRTTARLGLDGLSLEAARPPLGFVPSGTHGGLAPADLAHLRSLGLSGIRFGAPSLPLHRLPALLSASRIGALTLRDVALDVELLDALVGAGALDGLSRLDLGSNPLGAALVGRVLSNARLSALETLTLSRCGLGDVAMQWLSDAGHPPRLAALDLSDNPLGGRGVRALAAWPGLSGLRFLRLSLHPRSFGTGVAALLSSPHLAPVHLEIPGLPAAQREALRERFGDAVP